MSWYNLFGIHKCGQCGKLNFNLFLCNNCWNRNVLSNNRVKNVKAMIDHFKGIENKERKRFKEDDKEERLTLSDKSCMGNLFVIDVRDAIKEYRKKMERNEAEVGSKWEEELAKEVFGEELLI